MTVSEPPTNGPDGEGTEGASEGPRPTPTSEQSDELERLRAEVALLRQSNARLALELQIDRQLRQDSPSPEVTSGSLGPGTRLFRPAGGEGYAPQFTWLGRLAHDARSAIRGHVRSFLPEREAAAAAPWRLTAVEAGALLVVVVIAALARFYELGELPRGMQGDEASAALEGRRIREDGWVGPYSFVAAGSPTGMFYAVSLAQRLFGDSIHSARLVVALFGTLTVPLLYVLTRRSFGPAAALAAAGFLATMGWHLHYSRIAFPNVTWPFFVLLGMLALAEAARTGGGRWWAVAGAAFGLGVYTYNSHMLLLALVAFVIAFHLFRWPVLGVLAALVAYVEWPGFMTLVPLATAVAALLASTRLQNRSYLRPALVFGGVLILVALPMFRFIGNDANDYFGYSRRLSIFNSEEWAAQPGTAEQYDFLFDRYTETWDRICCHPQVDGVDATGVTALIPRSTLVLAGVGLGFALWRQGRIASVVGAIVVAAMPLASALSVDFALRRSLVVTVFVAMFAGIGVVEAVRWARARRPPVRYPAIAIVVLLAILSVYRNLDDFYGTTLESEAIHRSLAVEMVAAGHYVDDLPDHAYVLFFSNRWPWNHEIRRYLAPDARGEDRSETFGTYGFGVDPARGRPVFLFLGAYRDDVENAAARYPDGEMVVAGDPDDPDYVVYLPPDGMTGRTPDHTGPPPAATPSAEPAGRG